MDSENHLCPIIIDPSMVGPSGILKPEAYLQLLVRAQEPYWRQYGLDMAKLQRDYRASWVLLAATVEIHRPVAMGDILYVRVDCTEITHVLFRHDLIFRDSAGCPVISAVRFHGLLDMATRRLCRHSPAASLLPVFPAQALTPAQSRISPEVRDMQILVQRPICPSWIDLMGHVNNLRYAELIYDALPDAKRMKLHRLRRMEFYFLRELPAEGWVSIQGAESPSGFRFAGFHSDNAEPAFYAALSFDPAEQFPTEKR